MEKPDLLAFAVRRAEGAKHVLGAIPTRIGYALDGSGEVRWRKAELARTVLNDLSEYRAGLQCLAL